MASDQQKQDLPTLVEDVGSGTKYVFGDVAKPNTLIFMPKGIPDADKARQSAAYRSILEKVDTFQFFKISPGADRPHYSNKSFDPKAMFPHQKRLGHVFLALLGRAPDIEEAIPLCPNVGLNQKLSERTDPDAEVVLSHASVDAVAKREIDTGFLPDEVWGGVSAEYTGASVPEGLRVDPEHSTYGPPAASIYGESEFRISVKEVQDLEKSVTIATSPVLPRLFYAALVRFTTKSKQYQLFFDIRRSVPLEEFSDTQDEYNAQTRELLAVWLARRDTARGSYDGLLAERAALHEEYTADPEGKAGLLSSIYDINSRLARCRVVARNANIKVQRLTDRDTQAAEFSISCEIESFIADVRARPAEYGFDAGEEQVTVKKALTELCTDICISQRGYFFVDGQTGRPNQIYPKTRQQIVFLSSPGLDFCDPSSTRLEAKKYFQTTEENGTVKLTAFLSKSQADLLERVIRLYRVIYRSCKHHKVRNPSMLAMGLGVFLENVPDKDKKSVAEAYFLAQWLLLTEEDWGFDTYWINPVFINPMALPTLETVLNQGRELKCNVVMHNRDVKFLCVEMAKGMEFLTPAMLNPSDCASMWLGLMGYFWEMGRQDGYVGEEDFCCSGTGVLALRGITEAYGSPDRHLPEDRVASDDTAGGAQQRSQGKKPAPLPTLENVLAATTATSAATQLVQLCTLIASTPEEADHLNTLAEHALQRHSGAILEYYRRTHRGATDTLVMLTKVCATPGASLALVKLMVEKLEVALSAIPCPCQAGVVPRPGSRRSIVPSSARLDAPEDVAQDYVTTPLHAAARFGHIDILLYLMLGGHPVGVFERPSKLSVYDVAASVTHKSALLATACSKLLRVAESKRGLHPLLLVSSEAEADQHRTVPIGPLNKQKWTVLHWSAALNNIHLLRKVLRVPDLDPSARDVDGWTALHWVVVRGGAEMLQVLLSASLRRIDVRHTDFGSRALLQRFALEGGLWEAEPGRASASTSTHHHHNSPTRSRRHGATPSPLPTGPASVQLVISEQLHHGSIPQSLSNAHPNTTVFKGELSLGGCHRTVLPVLLVMEPPALHDGAVRQRGHVKKNSEAGGYRFSAFSAEFDVRSAVLRLTQGNMSLALGAAWGALQLPVTLAKRPVGEGPRGGDRFTTALHTACRAGLNTMAHVLAQYSPALLGVRSEEEGLTPFVLSLLHFTRGGSGGSGSGAPRTARVVEVGGDTLGGGAAPLAPSAGRPFAALVLSTPSRVRRGGGDTHTAAADTRHGEIRRRCILSLREAISRPLVAEGSEKTWVLRLIERDEEAAVGAMLCLLHHPDMCSLVRRVLVYALHCACALSGGDTRGRGDTALVSKVLAFITTLHKLSKAVSLPEVNDVAESKAVSEPGTPPREGGGKHDAGSHILHYLRQPCPTEGELREAERDLNRRLWCSRYLITKGFDKLVRRGGATSGLRALFRSGSHLATPPLKVRAVGIEELKVEVQRIEEREQEQQLFMSAGFNTNDGDRVLENLLSLHTALLSQGEVSQASELAHSLCLVLQAHYNGVESALFVAARFQRSETLHYIFRRYADLSGVQHSLLGMGMGAGDPHVGAGGNISQHATRIAATHLQVEALLQLEIKWRRWDSANAVLPYVQALRHAEAEEVAGVAVLYSALPSGEVRMTGAEREVVYANPPCLQELLLCAEHSLADPRAFTRVLACHAMWLAGGEDPKHIVVKYEQRRMKFTIKSGSAEAGNMDAVFEAIAQAVVSEGAAAVPQRECIRFVSATHINVQLTYDNVTDGAAYTCSFSSQPPRRKTVSIVSLTTGDTHQLVILDHDVGLDVTHRVKRTFRVPDAAMVDYRDGATGAYMRELTYPSVVDGAKYSVQFSGKTQLTWAEVSRSQTPSAVEATAALRYLFGADTVNMNDFFAAPENRTHFPYFDFGDRTKRSGELLLVVCHQLAMEGRDTRDEPCAASTDATPLLPEGFTLCEVTFTPVDYASLKHPLHALLLLSYYGSTRQDLRNVTHSAVPTGRKHQGLETPEDALFGDAAPPRPSVDQTKKRASELLVDVVAFINCVISDGVPPSVPPAIRSYAKSLASHPLTDLWPTGAQHHSTTQHHHQAHQLPHHRVVVEDVPEGPPIPLQEYRGALPIELAVRLYNVPALEAMLGDAESAAGLEVSVKVVPASVGPALTKVRVMLFKDAWFPDNDEFDDGAAEGAAHTRSAAATRRPLLHQALDHLPFPMPTRYMLHSVGMVKTFLLRFPFVSCQCSSYVRHVPSSEQISRGMPETQSQRVAFLHDQDHGGAAQRGAERRGSRGGVQLSQQAECRALLESVGVPWFPPGNQHFPLWAREAGEVDCEERARRSIVQVLLRSAVPRGVMQTVSGVHGAEGPDDETRHSLARAVLMPGEPGELPVSRQFDRCGLFKSVPLSLSAADAKRDWVLVKVMHHNVEILRAKLSPDIYVVEVRQQLLKKTGVERSTLSASTEPLPDDCQLHTISGGQREVTLFYDIQEHSGQWRERTKGTVTCNLYGEHPSQVACQHAHAVPDPHWSCCGSTDRASTCSNPDATRAFLLKGSFATTQDGGAASAGTAPGLLEVDSSSSEADGDPLRPNASFRQKGLKGRRAEAQASARWQKLGELGLAKLLQRCPHALHACQPEAVDAPADSKLRQPLRETLLSLLVAHPFPSPEALDFAVTRSFSPILVESRHSWARAFRCKPRVPKDGTINPFQGAPEQPYDVGAPKISSEAPGEQALLLDVGLGLAHWASLLSDEGLLSVVLDTLGIPLFGTDAVQIVPPATLCLGYTSMCYAAYSAANDVLDLSASWTPTTDVAGMHLANYQHDPDEGHAGNETLSLAAYSTSHTAANRTPRCSWCLAAANPELCPDLVPVVPAVANPLREALSIGSAASLAAQGLQGVAPQSAPDTQEDCERCTLLSIQVQSQTPNLDDVPHVNFTTRDYRQAVREKYAHRVMRDPDKGLAIRRKARRRSSSRAAREPPRPAGAMQPFDFFVLLTQWAETVGRQVNCSNWEGGGGQVAPRALTPTAGETPLMVACKFCHLQTVRRLLASAVVKRGVTNAEGYDAHDIAVSLQHRALLQAGGDTSSADAADPDDGTDPAAFSLAQLAKLVDLLNSQSGVQKKLTSFTKSELRWSAHVMLFMIVVVTLVLTRNSEDHFLTSSALGTVVTTEEWNTTTIEFPSGAEQGIRTFREDLSATLELEDLYAWFSEPFISKVLNEENLYGLFQLVGTVRITKLVADERPCDSLFWPFLASGDYLRGVGTGKCYPEYSSGGLTPSTSQAWAGWDESFQSPLSLNTYPLHRGAYLDVSRDNYSAMSMLSGNEETPQWVDHTSRFVSVLFTFYNRHVDIFVVGQIFFEIFAHGAIQPSHRFRSVRVNSYVSPTDCLRFVCEIAVGAFLVFHAITELVALLVVLRAIIGDVRRCLAAGAEEDDDASSQAGSPRLLRTDRHSRGGSVMGTAATKCSAVARNGLHLFRPVWRRLKDHVSRSLLDIGVLVVQGFWVSTLLRVRLLQSSLAEERDLLATAEGPEKKFHDLFVPLAWQIRRLDLLVGWLVLLAVIRVLKPISRIPRYGPIVKALISTMTDQNLFIFGIVFFGVIVAFYFCMMAAFGSTSYTLRSPAVAALTIFKMVLGDTEALPELEKEHNAWGPLLFILVIIFCQIVLLNLIVAVLQEIYVGAISNAQRDWSMNVVESYKYTLTTVVDPTSVTAVLVDCARKLRVLRIRYPERALKLPVLWGQHIDWWVAPQCTSALEVASEEE